MRYTYRYGYARCMHATAARPCTYAVHTPCAQAATAGKTLVPTRTRPHGEGLQGLCSSINHAGNTIAVGCTNGKLLVLDSHTMTTMDTLDLNALAPAPADARAAVHASGVPDPTLSITAVRYMPSSTGSSQVGHEGDAHRSMHMHRVYRPQPTLLTVPLTQSPGPWVSGSYLPAPDCQTLCLCCSQAVVVAALGTRVLHVHVSTGKVLRTTDEGLNKVSDRRKTLQLHPGF